MMLRHRLIGHGPQHVMVLHGWFGHELFLEPMLPALDEKAFTFCCVAYRGYGASMALDGDFTLDEIAADVLDTADALGWRHFDVMGHSMGGKAALRLMLLAPARVRRIVALTPVPAGAVPFDEAAWALFSGAAADMGKRRAIIDFSTGGRLDPAWVRQLAAHSWARSTQRAFAAYLTAWARSDFAEQVQGAPAPLLALVGEHDPSLTADVMRATYLAAMPRARLVTLANAGHYPIDEVPIATATEVQRFLRADAAP